MKLNPSHILLGILIVLAIAGGVAITVWPSVSESSVHVVQIVPTAAPVPASASNQTDTQVGVYLSGSVVNPGVYVTDVGSRLANVLLLAGGATAEADLTVVNLAAIVHDEDHWHIPERDEVLSSFSGLPKPGENVQPAAAVQYAQHEIDKVDLNGADVELLKSLPGIGDARAQAIVSYREANGEFSSVDGLLGVNGIGIGTIDNIRELVTVD